MANKRRGRGEGTLFQTDYGRWRAQVSIAGRRHGKTFTDKTDARRWLKSTAAAETDSARSELRERIKQDELQAEQYQQTIIEEYARGLTTSASVAGAGSMLAVEQNCEALLGRLGIVLSDREQAVLQRLFNAVSSLEPTPAEYPNSRA